MGGANTATIDTVKFEERRTQRPFQICLRVWTELMNKLPRKRYDGINSGCWGIRMNEKERDFEVWGVILSSTRLPGFECLVPKLS